MGLKLVKTETSGRIPVIIKGIEVATGGFKLVTTGLPANQLVPVGTPISCNEETRQAVVLKSAILASNVADDAVEYPVKKGHFLVVGEYLGASEGGAAYAITEIDTSNAAYDVVTVGTTLGVALSAGAVLFKSSATGATAAALHVAPTGLLWEDVKIEDNTSLSSLIRGTVYAKRIANGAHEAVRKALPLIVFSESY